MAPSNDSNQTFVFYKYIPLAPVERRLHNDSQANLVVLPLVACLALFMGICIKITHWWNEDIREADGILQNAFSPKYPHRKVLVRVLSTESETDMQRRQSLLIHQQNQRDLFRQSSLADTRGVDSDVSCVSNVRVYRQRSDSSRHSIKSQPITSPMVYHGDIKETKRSVRAKKRVPPLVMPSENDSYACMCELTRRTRPRHQVFDRQTSSGSSQGKSSARRTEGRVTHIKTAPGVLSDARAYERNRKRRPRDHPQRCHRDRQSARAKSSNRKEQTSPKRSHSRRQKGVSNLVMDSVNFNLNLMHLAMNSDLDEAAQRSYSLGSRSSQESITPYYKPDESGYIEDSFIHPCGSRARDETQYKRDSTPSCSPLTPLSPADSQFTPSSASCSVAVYWDMGSPQSPSSISPVYPSKPSLVAKYLSSVTSSLSTSFTSLSRSSVSQLNDSRSFYRITSATSMDDGTEGDQTRDQKSAVTSSNGEGDGLLIPDRPPDKFTPSAFPFPPSGKTESSDKPVFYLV